MSTEEQVDGMSLYNQERAIRTYADTHDLELVRIYSDEGFSAKTAKRPELQRMLEAIRLREDEVAGIIVYNISRISRNIESYYREIAPFTIRNNIRLYSTQENIDDSPQGKLAQTIYLAMHQLDNDMKSEVVEDNMRLLAKEGWWQGKIPYGYKPVRIPVGIKIRDGKVETRLTLEPELDNDLAEKIRLFLTRFSDGDISQTQLINYADSIGLKSATGGRYTPQSVNNMLKYSVYAGYIKNELTDFEMVRAKHAGIISLDTYIRNQDLLKSMAIRPGIEKFNNDYPLKNTLICSGCKKSVTGSAPR